MIMNCMERSFGKLGGCKVILYFMCVKMHNFMLKRECLILC